MAEYTHVTLERADAVGRVVVDRPETHNALNVDAASELRDATFELIEDDDLRAIVLTGTEGAFCTGADLTTMEGDATDGQRLRGIATRLHATIGQLVNAPKPVVAGVNGVAAGGGLGLALSADLVVVRDDAKLEFAYPRIGLSGDGGATYFLPRLVGLRRAMEIVLLDEPIHPERAVEWGLATECVPADEFEQRVAELAADVADGPTVAYDRLKELLHRSFGRDLGSQMAAEAESVARLTRTDDYVHGIESFGGDEPPSFDGT